MPALICKSCEIEAFQAFNFRRKVQNSQEYFDRKLSILDFIPDTFENDDIEDVKLKEQDITNENLDETIEEYLDYPDESNDIIDLSTVEEFQNSRNDHKVPIKESPDNR